MTEIKLVSEDDTLLGDYFQSFKISRAFAAVCGLFPAGRENLKKAQTPSIFRRKKKIEPMHNASVSAKFVPA